MTMFALFEGDEIDERVSTCARSFSRIGTTCSSCKAAEIVKRVDVVSVGPIDTSMLDNVSDEVRRAPTNQIHMNILGLLEGVTTCCAICCIG